ncbi:hypothetical protein Q4601_03185 [Shewanella sp. 1_MG-2023]|uniref:hypothetical protein n=1 Tax=unclassified Shewanella TaxID=196818 RepID=UPI0026E25443|nr:MULTISPECIES: hypothetical protein [unclassified Shewanella]MDO6610561.1 hypothetical protein [Shewanella sp. 7_MG-2023]MDO6770686.1 hypothetical protein [Shewanella sp. 2_MG-2023]MDO6793296.1 hypothetical protein [Shewanella sp. 1_MG-2023]
MIEVYTKEYWLNELKESAQFLESLYRTTVWDNELEFKTEKAVFLGCYAIRKLKESKLLSTELSGFNTSLISHPIRSEHDSIVDEKWSKKYNFGQSDSNELALERLCNQFIHSKIYSPFVPGGQGCMGFFFASDKEYRKQVYYVQLIKIVSLFLSVVHNKKVNLELEVNGAEVSAINLSIHT